MFKKNVTEKENPLFDTYTLKTGSYIPKVGITYPKKQNALINLPSALPENVANVILKIDYLRDDLFNGTTWRIGLADFLKNGELNLNIADLDDKVSGLAAELRNEIKTKGTGFKGIKALPQYQEILPVNN